jgi:hypothetical protein
MISLRDALGPDYEAMAELWTKTTGLEFTAADVRAAVGLEADMKMWEDAFAVLKPPPDEWEG